MQTLRLRFVEVTTEHYKSIHLGMSKCSMWMFGHDKSKALDVNRPAPVEVEEDIDALGGFVKSVRKRRDALGKEREASLQPECPETG